MTGIPSNCSNCGYALSPDQRTCPNCGNARKTIHANITMEPIELGAKLTTTVERIRREIKANWALIITLIACDVISVVPAYFLSGWASVAVTIFFIILSTVLGYFAITRIITITRETQ